MAKPKAKCRVCARCKTCGAMHRRGDPVGAHRVIDLVAQAREILSVSEELVPWALEYVARYGHEADAGLLGVPRERARRVIIQRPRRLYQTMPPAVLRLVPASP